MKDREHGFTMLEIMIVVAVIGLLAAMALPAFVKVRQESRAKGCINNMRIMDNAKEEACMEYRWSQAQTIDTDSPQETNVWVYIKGAARPKCPSGGTYSWNRMGVKPSCTLTNEGHIAPN